MFDFSKLPEQNAQRYYYSSGFDDRISVDYSLWMKQKSEIMTLRLLVVMQLLGIFVMGLAMVIMLMGLY